MMQSVNPFRPFRSGPRIRAGFTLIELTISLTITSIVMVGMGSAMVIAARSLPNPDSRGGQVIDSGRVVDQIAAEVAYAVTIEKATSTDIAFSVLRNGSLQVISYSWTGTLGAPLLRSIDGSPEVVIATNVQDFGLVYDTDTVVQATPEIESSEILLSSHPAAAVTQDYAVGNNNWIGQYFFPDALPIEASSWKVTRVLLEASVRGANNGETQVQLRLPDINNMPESVVLEQQQLLESDLSNGYLWIERQFTNVSGLTPDTGLCIVLKWIADSDSADFRFDSGSGSNMLTTGDGGGSWSNENSQSMTYYVYGTYFTPDLTPQPVIGELQAIEISLNTSTDPASYTMTRAMTFNKPNVDMSP